MSWQPVIGLEVHVQLMTKSKLFSATPTAYGADPNTQACPIDLGMPGVLPVLNQQAVDMGIKFGLAIDAAIATQSVFARKNYFYPDLPKGYQISQYEFPIVGKGHLDIETTQGIKRIGITRAHLEEDAGKSIHDAFPAHTAIDLNRSGTPLLEIVSEPDMLSAQEAIAYLKTLHSLVRYLDICDGNMQEGSFRCDANISVRPKSSEQLGIRAEIKNINSFKFVEKAINYEIERQIQLLESNQPVKQETRLYDTEKGETRAMRSKEDAHDYRYFPDPDLLPVQISEEQIEKIRSELPELPNAKCERFEKEYNLSAYDARVLVSDKALSAYFENTLSQSQAAAKLTAHWITGDILGALNKNNLSIDDCPITSAQLAQLLDRIHDNTITGTIAKTVFESIWNEGGMPDDVISAKGLKQIDDSDTLAVIINEIIASNPQQVQQYLDGKEKLWGFFIGQAMKRTQGRANPQQLNQLLKEKLVK